MSAPRIAVIGAGITGLALAYELSQRRPDAEIRLIEKDARVGGTIETVRRDGCLLEAGPDSFISEKPQAVELARRLGIDGELIGTRSECRRSFIVRGGRLIPVPEGFYLVSPTKLWPFAWTGLFSPWGKLRMACEPFVGRARGVSDESIGAFIRRRFGREALERAGQPMLAGIYTGDPDRLSLRAVMPRFLELEERYGSVLVGLIRQSRERRSLSSAGGPRYSLFMSFSGGLQTLTDAVAARLPHGCLETRREVRQLSHDLLRNEWKLTFADGSQAVYDQVCSTLPAWATAKLVSTSAPVLADRLNEIPYESVATLNFAVPRAAVRHPLNGFGFVVPRTEKRALIACTFVDRKFEGRAPQGRTLLRAFMGGAFGREWMDRDDRALEQAAWSELSELLGISVSPDFCELRRYPKAMVQYALGHHEQVARIDAEASKHRGLFLAGTAYRGVGIPDAIRDAAMTAERMLP